MKKSTILLYLALLIGTIVGSCTPCDDGDPIDQESLEINRAKMDSLSVD